jgi:hypothetical protein
MYHTKWLHNYCTLQTVPFQVKSANDGSRTGYIPCPLIQLIPAADPAEHWHPGKALCQEPLHQHIMVADHGSFPIPLMSKDNNLKETTRHKMVDIIELKTVQSNEMRDDNHLHCLYHCHATAVYGFHAC